MIVWVGPEQTLIWENEKPKCLWVAPLFTDKTVISLLVEKGRKQEIRDTKKRESDNKRHSGELLLWNFKTTQVCSPSAPPSSLPVLPPLLKGEGSSPDSWHSSLPCYIELCFMYLSICLPRLWTPQWQGIFYSLLCPQYLTQGCHTAAWWRFLVGKKWSRCLGLTSCCPSPSVSNTTAYLAFSQLPYLLLGCFLCRKYFPFPYRQILFVF